MDIDDEQVTSTPCTQCSKKHCNGIRHNNNTKYVYPSCHLCGIELCDLIELLEHKYLRNTESCEICFNEYIHKKDLDIHFESHFLPNRNKSKNIFYCINCDDPLNTEVLDDGSNKLYTTYTDSTDSTIPEIFEKQKRKTTTIYTNKRTVSNTKQFIANDNDQIINHSKKVRKTKSETVKITSDQFDIDKNVVCSICDRRYGTELELSFHFSHLHTVKFQTTRSRQQFKCRLCDKIFTTIRKRALHEKIHQNKETNLFYCPHCDTGTKNMQSLEYHMITHVKELKYLCDICGKGFQRFNNLRGHYSSHNIKRAYSCKICNKTFKTSHLRNRHGKKAHNDEKPLKCEMCEQRFKEHTDLRRHRWTHGGYEKLFKCAICDKRFYENKLLRYHMKCHEKETR